MGRKKIIQRIVSKQYNADYDNSMRKINVEKRDTYEYHFSEKRTKDKGRKVEYLLSSVVITPELLMEEGKVNDWETAVLMIKAMHQIDDAQVNINLKNAKPPMTDEQKEELREWMEAHPKEKPPKNYNESFEGFWESDDALYDMDKSPVARATSTTDTYNLEDINEVRKCMSALNDEQFEAVKDHVLDYMKQFEFGMDHIRKILEPLTDIQFARYLLVHLMGFEGKDIAKLFGVSPSKITESLNLSREKIEELKKNKKSIGEGEF